MIELSDSYSNIKGRVQMYNLSPMGIKLPVFDSHNIITYQAPTIMTRVLGGDAAYIPNYMGFLFGNSNTPLLNDSYTRDQSWSKIEAELTSPADTYNILVVPLAANPSFVTTSTSASSVYYKNSVVFNGVTGLAGSEYAFPGGVGKTALADGDYFYSIFLLSRIVNVNGTISYIPFARVSLKTGGQYIHKKMVGAQFSAYWTITFF